jgi:thioredoxin-like negative regulator of GroEL
MKDPHRRHSRPSNLKDRASRYWQGVRPALFALAVGVAIYYVTAPSSGPEVGTVAKDFELPLASGEGKRFRLSDHHGTPVLVEAFASWCRACRNATPILAEASRAERARQVRFLAVGVNDSPEDAFQAARSWGIPFDVAVDDGSFARGYEISRLPTILLVSAEGKVVHTASGSISRSKLESWLDSVGATRSN